MEKSFLKERIDEKIELVEKYLSELLSFKLEELEKYKKDLKIKAACERYIEKIAEGITDLAILLIKYKKFDFTDEDEKSFHLLSKNKIIDDNLANKLSDLRWMRDRLAHRYDTIDDILVFQTINEEIEKDINEFITKIKSFLSEEIK